MARDKTAGPDAPTNYEVIRAELNAVGYYMVEDILDPKDFGVPTSRPRLFAVAVLVADGPVKDNDKPDCAPEWALRWRRCMAAMKVATKKRLSICRLLYPEDHVRVREANVVHGDSSKDLDKDEAIGESSTGIAAYEVDHLELYKLHGLN